MSINSNIRRVEGMVPAAYDRTMQGVVVLDPTDSTRKRLAVNVQGNILPARWVDPVVAALGDTVLVQLNIGLTGGTEAIVKGRVTANPRPATGTVATVPVGSPTITVTGSDGLSYTASFVTSYTPTVGDLVFFSWFGSHPTVMGKVATPAAPPPPAPAVAPPPSAAQSGETQYPASDSATIWPSGGWNSWASGKNRVYQGSYGSGQVYGSWFYAGSPGQLAGRTITRLRIVLGSRLSVGSYNSPVTVHFYAHSSLRRPAQFTDVTRTVGPDDHVAVAGQGLTQYDLPISFATQVISGGGISIALDPYAGFYGALEQPDSGKLIFDWSM